MQISILHPFTPKAAGVVENRVATYHSQPHAKALQHLVKEKEWEGTIVYLTPKRFKYRYTHNNLEYCFYPVSRRLNGDHKKWKKQQSAACLKAYKKDAPEVTIINMSGHSSPFSHQLAKEIKNQGKAYIAMLGGQHYTNTPENRMYYHNAHHILVHTLMQKQAMQHMDLFKGTDIRVFPLGVDTEVFKPITQTGNRAPSLLYVGRIVEWKQVHLAIDALKELVANGFNNAKLNIIGPVSSKPYLQRLKAMVKRYGVEQQVVFLGHKEHHELPSYFQQADLLLLPSDKETFGMVMVEAMACGTPVAAMDCSGGPADVITHEIDGLLGTTETYTEMVCRYFKHVDGHKKMKQVAREKVLAEYSLEKTYDVLLQSVTDALNS